ncbi:MAG: hypothetical protein AAFX85_07165, partial [Pseudomonadota bacterium]
MPIAYLYETETQARDAAQQLGSEFPNTQAYVFAPASHGDVAAALEGEGFPADDAALYASQVTRGRSLVVTAPLFGEGVRAKATLEAYSPVELGALPSAGRRPSARYTPFSEFLSLPLLTERRQQAWFWGDALKRPDVASLGIPRLLSNPTPLSSLLGLSTHKRPDVTSLGQPRLKRPDVASLGLPRLLKDPTP